MYANAICKPAREHQHAWVFHLRATIAIRMTDPLLVKPAPENSKRKHTIPLLERQWQHTLAVIGRKPARNGGRIEVEITGRRRKKRSRLGGYTCAACGSKEAAMVLSRTRDLNVLQQAFERETIPCPIWSFFCSHLQRRNENHELIITGSGSCLARYPSRPSPCVPATTFHSRR